MTNDLFLAANCRPRIHLNAATRLTQYLGNSSQIKVTVGQAVAPHDILGTFEQTSGFFSINLAKKLGASAKEVGTLLKKQLQDRVYQGELLAEKKSLFGKSVVTAPTDGVIESYNDKTGDLRLKYFPKITTVTAGVYGIVDSVNSELGQVHIKTIAHQIYGVLGSGHQRMGLLRILNGRANLFQNIPINYDNHQQILVTGALIEEESLKQAIQAGVSGIITGGINYSHYKPLINPFETKNNQVTDHGVSILVTEGFGALPIANDIFELLQQHQDKFAYISGFPPKILLPTATPDSIISLRNIVLPPPEQDQQLPEVEVQALDIGMKVKVTYASFIGAVGEVVAIDQTPSLIESGINTYLLTIEIPGRKIKVPYPNVEIIK